MIAIPVKTNKKNPPVSTLFGKSKWFALVDNQGNVSIEANGTESGREVVENMIKKGVNKLVFHHMGGNPFMLLQKANIECFHDGGKRILLDEILVDLKDNKLIKIDGSNMNQYIEQGNMHKNERNNHKH
jgi:predicted Fe-Mo cluster-binding NifX family protein